MHGSARPSITRSVAFSNPDLFVADPFDANGLRQVDVESGPRRLAGHPGLARPPALPLGSGTHRHTALRWVAYARRDWAEHLTARAADEDTPPL